MMENNKKEEIKRQIQYGEELIDGLNDRINFNNDSFPCKSVRVPKRNVDSCNFNNGFCHLFALFSVCDEQCDQYSYVNEHYKKHGII